MQDHMIENQKLSFTDNTSQKQFDDYNEDSKQNSDRP